VHTINQTLTKINLSKCIFIFYNLYHEAFSKAGTGLDSFYFVKTIIP
jgi:hypothetical protein